MAVWCRQTAPGQPESLLRIEPHTPEQTDDDLLAAKAAGALDKGWTVELGHRAFVATKVRWGGILCTREFWAD